nr:ASCH domain-containing protein [uncultured Desulfobacter sp.]
MKILHLNLKKKYWEKIKSGEKKYEYRLVTRYWAKRLVGKQYDKILIKLGYPKKDDVTRIIERPYRGWGQLEITHPEFGSDPVQVYAIRVN